MNPHAKQPAHTAGTLEICKLASPEYAPQFGIYAVGDPRDLATVKGPNSRADAERLVACWNALHGCNPEAVAEVIAKAQAVIDHRRAEYLGNVGVYADLSAALAKLKGTP